MLRRMHLVRRAPCESAYRDNRDRGRHAL